MRGLYVALMILVLMAVGSGYPQPDLSNVEIETVPVRETVYLLKGRGGNIGLCVGEDGVLMVDDQFEPLSEKINQAIDALSESEIRFVLNTHWHGDHTGINTRIIKATYNPLIKDLPY